MLDYPHKASKRRLRGAALGGSLAVYRNQWNLKYSMDVAFGLEAKPNCLLEDADQGAGQ